MHKILLMGAGKIGRAITALLVQTGDYDVLVSDASDEALQRIPTGPHCSVLKLDATNAQALAEAMQGRDAVLSALSFSFNPLIAQVASETSTSYFDLTEDVETTRKVRAFADKCAN